MVNDDAQKWRPYKFFMWGNQIQRIVFTLRGLCEGREPKMYTPTPHSETATSAARPTEGNGGWPRATRGMPPGGYSRHPRGDDGGEAHHQDEVQ